MAKVFDAVARMGTYTTQDGQEKTIWKNIGAVFENSQGQMSMKLEMIPVGGLNDNGELWISFFEPQQRQQRQPQQQRQPPQQQRQPVTQQQQAQIPAAEAPPPMDNWDQGGDEDVPF